MGLYGSSHFAASLSEDGTGLVRATLNLEVVGSGDYTSISGDEGISELALAFTSELCVQVESGILPPGATSDHESF